MADTKFLSNLVVDGNLELTAGTGYQIKNATFESLTEDPATNLFVGRMIYRSDLKQVRVYDGGAWGSITGDITGVTAGVGLSGGGTSGAPTLALDLSELTEITSVQNGDFIAVTDASDSHATKKFTAGALSNYVHGKITGDITISNSVATISANSVALGTDTTGNYVATLGTLTGLTTTGNTGEGATPTLAVTYGTTANTALEGNTTVDDVSVSNLETRLAEIDSNVTIGNASTVEVSTSGDFVVGGNLTVEGTTTTVNSTTVAIDDHHFKVATDNSTTNDFGFYGRYGSTAEYAGLFYDVSGESWKFYHGNGSEPGNTTFSPTELSNITAASFKGSLVGEASTAAQWTNARTITLGGDLTGSVSIDGTANVTLDATVAANSVALGTDTTGDYVASVGVTASTGLSVTGTGEGASVTLAGVDATESVKGVVQLATNAQALAGTATDKVVTPAGLAARSYTETIGDGSATSFTVTHSLGTRNVMVQMYDATTYETVYAEVTRTSTTAVNVRFNNAPEDSDITVLVTKVD